MQPPVPENRPVGEIPGPESNYMPPVPGLPQGLSLPADGAGVEPYDPDAPRRAPGRIRQQDETTQSRPESVGEARARQRAQRQRAEDQEREAREAADAAAKKARRRKQMIGAGVGVGVVGAIALLYVAIPDNDGGSGQQATGNATCVVGQGDDAQVVADSYCSTGTYNPVTGFILLNGMSYRYNYGGSVNNGRVVGGSYDRAPNTSYRTSSGAAVDPGKATSFGSNGQTNAGSKPAPPANSGGSNKGGSSAGSNNGKNIDRGGLGTSNKGGSSGGSKSSGS